MRVHFLPVLLLTFCFTLHLVERAKTLYAVLTTGVRRTPSSAKGHQQKLKVDTATARMELRKMLAGEFEDQQEQDGEAQHS
eukprot:m.89320 g.89320  ORF g.89320 m.89320 type:complete len:81 (+) comp12890_c0_seq2:245-487(+)